MDFEKSKIYGTVVSAISCGIVLLLLLLIFMPIQAKEEGGVMISFGDVDFGAGQVSIPQATPQQSAAPAPTPAPRTPQTEEVITQTYEESLAIAEQKRKEREREEVERKRREEADRLQREQERIARERQQAIDRANEMGGLFGNSNTQGSGTTSGDDRQGNPVGQGTQGGNSWSLAGRGLNGTLTLPAYNMNIEGRITVNIRVDKTGKVISAQTAIRGTDISNAELRKAAEQAALSTRFTAGTNDNAEGTITYNFRLR